MDGVTQAGYDLLMCLVLMMTSNKFLILCSGLIHSTFVSTCYPVSDLQKCKYDRFYQAFWWIRALGKYRAILFSCQKVHWGKIYFYINVWLFVTAFICPPWVNMLKLGRIYWSKYFGNYLNLIFCYDFLKNKTKKLFDFQPLLSLVSGTLHISNTEA